MRRLVDRMGLPLTRDAAICLYAALVCDTGRFQYESTTPEVFDLARELAVVRPADRAAVPHAVRGAPVRVPAAARRRPRGRRAGAGEALRVGEGHPGRPRAPRRHRSKRSRASSTSCAARGRPRSRACSRKPPTARWRVSLRSLGDVDVCRIAEHQGGGGHRFAAGFTSDAPADAVVAQASSRRSSDSSTAVHRRARRRRQAGGLDVARRRRRSCARSTGSGASATPARSIPTRPACCSSGSGRVTRLLRFLQETTKTYEARVVFGIATDTLDASGAVLERAEMPLTRAAGRAASRAFLGDIEQIPPMVSAIKVDGRRLHELARAGEEVERAPRRGAHRPLRGRGVRARPVPRGHGRGRLLERHLHTLARRRSRCRARRLRAPRRAAPAAGRLVRRRRGARARRDRGRPDADVLTPAQPRCATSSPSSSTASEARGVAHGATFAAPRAGSATTRAPGRSRSSTTAERCSRSTNAGRGREAGRRARASESVNDLPRSRRQCPDARAAASSPSARSTACTSATRRCCGSSATSPTRAAWPRRVRHLRPPPGRGRAPGIGAEAADDARAEARAARRDRHRRRVRRAHVRRGAQQGDGGGLRRRGARRACCAARLVVVGADFHFGYRRHGDVPLLERMGAELGFEVLGLGLVASADGTTAPTARRRTRRPGSASLLARGRRRGRGRASSAGRTRCAGRSSDGDARGRELGFPTANVAVPERICLPADGIYAGTFTRRPTASSARPPSRSAGVRRSTRTPGCRCSRPTCSTSTATSTASSPASRFLAPSPGRGALRRRRRPGRPDARGRRRHPAAPALNPPAVASDAGREPPGPSGTRPRPYPYLTKVSAHAMPDTTATITEHRLHETDTGSAEVQIALLTGRINHLTEHLKVHKKDHHSPPWPAHARRSSPSPARLPPTQRRRAVPGVHRQARPSPVRNFPERAARRSCFASSKPRARRRLSVATARRACRGPSGRRQLGTGPASPDKRVQRGAVPMTRHVDSRFRPHQCGRPRHDHRDRPFAPNGRRRGARERRRDHGAVHRRHQRSPARASTSSRSRSTSRSACTPRARSPARSSAARAARRAGDPDRAGSPTGRCARRSRAPPRRDCPRGRHRKARSGSPGVRLSRCLAWSFAYVPRRSRTDSK